MSKVFFDIGVSLDAGLIDDFTVHIAPVLIQNGIGLFENLDPGKISLEIIEHLDSPLTAHIKCGVKKKIIFEAKN